ncbi:MAG: hypothetical protein LBH98_01175 [Chitinispirillales bacterium]|jgi:hypothetical protein|nr:hypothetical protein [Chitinispirillales bacterium]
MIKKLTVLLCGFLSVILFAQDSTDEFIYRESKRLKSAGIATVIIGTVTTASGAVTILQTYKDSHRTNRANDGNSNGGYVAGGLICALGIGMDLLSIPIFKHRKEIVDYTRQNARISLIVKPNGLSFVAAF